jgi:hypothetical protein
MLQKQKNSLNLKPIPTQSLAKLESPRKISPTKLAQVKKANMAVTMDFFSIKSHVNKDQLQW